MQKSINFNKKKGQFNTNIKVINSQKISLNFNYLNVELFIFYFPFKFPQELFHINILVMKNLHIKLNAKFLIKKIFSSEFRTMQRRSKLILTQFLK